MATGRCSPALPARSPLRRDGAKRRAFDGMAGAADGVMNAEDETRSAHRSLRVLIIAAGISTSILYVVVGLISELQMFGDGSIFSYAVAAQDAWSFHWHNISGRLFTYVFAYIPAEAYVSLTKNAKGGIAIYGLLFFSAQMLGLLATLAADRTSSRVIFGYACLSTACLCPLVFGAPTEMWMAHAVFWPVLALCLCAPSNLRGAAAVFVALLALLFTHEGAIVLSAAMLFALFLRGWRDVTFVRALGAFFVVMTIWFIVKITIRPDDYIAGVLAAAAYKIIDIRNLAEPAFLLLLTALAGYGIAAVLLRRVNPARAHAYAAFACAAALAVYWVWFDKSLLTEARYNLRTVLLIAMPVLGVLAAVHAMHEVRRRNSSGCGWTTRRRCARSRRVRILIRPLATRFSFRRDVLAATSTGSHGIRRPPTHRCSWRRSSNRPGSSSMRTRATFGFRAKPQ